MLLPSNAQLSQKYVQLFCKVDIYCGLSTYDLFVSKTCCCTDLSCSFLLLQPGSGHFFRLTASAALERSSASFSACFTSANYQRKIYCCRDFFQHSNELFGRFVLHRSDLRLPYGSLRNQLPQRLAAFFAISATVSAALIIFFHALRLMSQDRNR